MKNDGFEGFKTIQDLFSNPTSIPYERGIYLVLYLNNDSPEFLSKGVGGYFKGKDPNVTLHELKSNWVDNTFVIYIGQAGGKRAGKWSSRTLNERISTYMKFGKGYNIGHYGGRYIWQLKNYRDLVICWKPFPNKTRDPKMVESQMIHEFKIIYGKRPFANLQD